MSAREMMTFVHFFAPMVGDLVQTDDEVWEFFLNFLELIDLLMYFEMSHDLINRIEILVQKHHLDYVRLFQDTLKPKHHLMTHYCTVIRQSGPPRKYWCFPFENQHKPFKMYTRSISSRKNVCVSIAKKFQLQFAKSLLQESALDDVVSFDSHTKIISEHINLINTFKSEMCIQSNFSAFTDCCYYGKHYKAGYHLFSLQGFQNHMEHIKIFEIQEIIDFECSNELPYVLCRRVPVKAYNAHLASYEIDNTKFEEFSLYSIEYFSGPPINVNTQGNGKCFVRIKNYY